MIDEVASAETAFKRRVLHTAFWLRSRVLPSLGHTAFLCAGHEDCPTLDHWRMEDLSHLLLIFLINGPEVGHSSPTHACFLLRTSS